MPRQRIRHSRETYAVPVDFPQRLRMFREESGLCRLRWPAASNHRVGYRRCAMPMPGSKWQSAGIGFRVGTRDPAVAELGQPIYMI